LEQGATFSVTEKTDTGNKMTFGDLIPGTPSVEVNRNTGFNLTAEGVVNICRDRGAFEAFIRRYGSTNKTTNPTHNDWEGEWAKNASADTGLSLFDTIAADNGDKAISNFDWKTFGLTTGTGLVSSITAAADGTIDDSMRFYIVNAMTGTLQFL
jgi:hypothetical protein